MPFLHLTGRRCGAYEQRPTVPASDLGLTGNSRSGTTSPLNSSLSSSISDNCSTTSKQKSGHSWNPVTLQASLFSAAASCYMNADWGSGPGCLLREGQTPFCDLRLGMKSPRPPKAQQRASSQFPLAEKGASVSLCRHSCTEQELGRQACTVMAPAGQNPSTG